MLIAYLIMLREGIEAALIVGIVASYLKQTGRGRWMPYVWSGVGAAVAMSLVLGLIIDLSSAEFPQKQQEMFEGGVALVATGMLTYMVLWMKKASRSIRSELQGSIDAALRPGEAQGRALVAMAFFATGREGVESVFFLLATVQQEVGPGVPAGAILGLLSAVAFGAVITYGGVKLNLRQFFRWTGLLIVFVAAGLLAASLRAFHEAGLWNGLQQTAFDIGGVLPSDGVLGTLLSGIFGYQESPTVGEVLVYLGFLIPVLTIFLMPSRPSRPMPQPA